MCDESTTVMPVSLTASITVFMNSRRASGSSEATGSSSSSSSGRLASASVSATCACWPPESFPTLRSSGRPRRSIRARARVVVPARVELAAELQRLRDREARGGAGDPARRSRRAGARRPRRVAASGRARCTVAGASAASGRRRAGAASSCRRRSGRRARSPSPPGSRACSRAAPSWSRSACRGPRSRSGRGAHATLDDRGRPQRVGEQRGDVARRRARPRARASIQRSSAGRRAFDVVGRQRRGVGGDEGADAAPALDEPLEVELAVGLEHRVRVDRRGCRRPPSRSAAGRPGAGCPSRIACLTCWTSWR